MAFLDDLSKKLTDASAKTIQMTKELTDTTRLNGLISEEENLLNRMYQQIGKDYVALCQGNPDPSMADVVAAVKASEAKIDDYKHQIANIKGIRTCEKCGAENVKDAVFCYACGAPMPKPVVPEGFVMCAGCGAMNPANMRFCTSCGKPLADVVPAAAPEAPVAPQEPVAPVATPSAPESDAQNPQ